MGRKNGLQLPLERHQVLAWVLFLFLALGVYIFYVPFVGSLGAQVALIVVYSLLLITILALGFFTSASDPSDPAVAAGSCDGEYYCAICQASVGPTSKHCKACDRCVEGFDHHCKWLNNCIGSSNYRSFFALVSLTVTMLAVQFGWGVFLLSRSFYDDDDMMVRVADTYGSGLHYRGWQAVLLLYLLLLAGCIVMLGELFSFHVVLVSKNMSTYDYIMAKRMQRDGDDSAAPRRASGNGARGGLCRSNRVLDPAAVVVPKRKAMNVSLNPCAACNTERLSGNIHDWEAAAKGAVKFTMPPEPEKPATAAKGGKDTLSSSFSACTTDGSDLDSSAVAAACTAPSGASGSLQLPSASPAKEIAPGAAKSAGSNTLTVPSRSSKGLGAVKSAEPETLIVPPRSSRGPGAGAKAAEEVGEGAGLRKQEEAQEGAEQQQQEQEEGGREQQQQSQVQQEQQRRVGKQQPSLVAAQLPKPEAEVETEGTEGKAPLPQQPIPEEEPRPSGQGSRDPAAALAAPKGLLSGRAKLAPLPGGVREAAAVPLSPRLPQLGAEAPAGAEASEGRQDS